MSPLLDHELIVDLFAGGGGASHGIYVATGRHPDIAINHDKDAISVHRRNHPGTEHKCESVWNVKPKDACGDRPVGLLWASPDCRHFSRASGGRPKWGKVRSLPGVVITWATRVRPRVIMVENVREMLGWGPLLDDGTPCPARVGRSFNWWVGRLRGLGYKVQWREMNAADYGAPTIRTRLVVQARCDGEPIVWPDHTHGKSASLFGTAPWLTAASCIDWSIPCPSIFTRKRPLAEATLRRIAHGVKKHVVDRPDPFMVDLTAPHISPFYGTASGKDTLSPLGSVTAQGQHHSLVSAVLAGCGGRAAQSSPRPIDSPMGTMTTKADQVLACAFLAPITHQGENRSSSITAPAPTITCAHRGEHALISAFLAQHNTGVVGRDARQPLATSTTTGTQINLVEASLSDTDRAGAERVSAFLIHYFSNGKQSQDLKEPLGTATTRGRYGLVTVHGRPIVDIGMRMLDWRELARAQSFPDSYDMTDDGKLTKTKAIHLIGNSVCPVLAAAVVGAAFGIRPADRRLAA